MRKKFLSVLLTLAMLLSLLPATASAVELTVPEAADAVIKLDKANTYTVSSDKEVPNEIQVSATGVILSVSANLTVTAPITIKSGSLTIQGEGTINTAGIVNEGKGTLTVKDGVEISGGNSCVIDNQNKLIIEGNVKITGTSDKSPCIRSSGTSFTISGGTVSGAGTGIALSGGTLTVTGGEISGADGVAVNSGTLYVQKSAKITGVNNGVTADGGTAYIQGGEISGADGVTVKGGTLYVQRGANAAGSDNGAKVIGTNNGVTVSGGGTAYMEGGAVSGGSGTGIAVSGGTLTVTGGAVSGGTGIAVSDGALAVESDAKITGSDKGIEISGGELTVSGGTVSGGAGSGAGIAVSGGTLTVQGGEISGGHALNFNAGAGKEITAKVTGGTFKGSIMRSGTIPEKFITGGTFSENVDQQLLDDSKEMAGPLDGVYQVIEKGSTTKRSGDVAQVVSGKYYPTLESAVIAAPSEGTVRLVDYVDDNSRGRLVITKTLTIEVNSKESLGLNLGGDAITVSGENGKLTIQDSEEFTRNVSSSGLQTVVVENGGTLTVKGAFISNTGSDSAAAILVKDNSKVFISSGNVEARGYGSSGVNIAQDGELTIYGGAVTAKGDGGTGVSMGQGSVFNMTTESGGSGTEGGAVAATGESGIGVRVMQKGTLTVTKGTISAEGKDGCAIYQPEFGTTTINDGMITGRAGIVAHAGKVTVNNGTIQATGDSKITVASGPYSSVVSPAGIVFDRSPSDAQGMILIYNGKVLAAAGEDAVVYTKEGRAPDPNDDDGDNRFIEILGSASANSTGVFSSSVSSFVNGSYQFEAKYREENSNRYCYYKSFDEAVNVVKDSKTDGAVNSLVGTPPPYNIRFYLNELNNGTSSTVAGTLFVNDNTKHYMSYQDDSVQESGTWPADPERTGYTFDGWYTVSTDTNGTRVTQGSGSEGTSLDEYLKGQTTTDIPLFARWIKDGAFVVNNTHYQSLKEAVAAANASSPVIIYTVEKDVVLALRDVPEKIGVNICINDLDHDFTLNLGGSTLNFTGSAGLAINSSAPAVTVTNGTIASENTAMTVSGNGSVNVTVQNVTVTGSDGIHVGNGALTLESGVKITGNTNGVVVEGGALTVKSGVEITGEGNGITVNKGGLTVLGGEISGGHALNFNAGSQTVNAAVSGGTFKSTEEGGPSVTVSGSQPTGFISGGRFLTVDDEKNTVPDMLDEAYIDANAIQLETGEVVSQDGFAVIKFDINRSKASDAEFEENVYEVKKIIAKGGTLPKEQRPTPKSEEHAFLGGWYTAAEGGSEVPSDYKFSEDTTLYAHWGYTITFQANDGTFGDGVYEIKVDTDENCKLAADKVPTPEYEGHTFLGWYTVDGDTAVNFAEPFGKHTEVSAHWGYTVTFDAAPGVFEDKNTKKTVVTDKDGNLKKPADPTRNGYLFGSWYTVDDDAQLAELVEFVNGSYTFTKDTDLSAYWTRDPDSSVYTITFYASPGTFEDGGDKKVADTDEEGMLNDLPGDPTYGGHTFAGWYEADKDTEVNFAYAFEKDTDLFAHWTKNEDTVYTITFDANGGAFESGDKTTKQTDEYGVLKDTDVPANPSLDGYTFNGWYTAGEGGDKVQFPYTFTKDTTVYAQWTEDPGGGSGDDGNSGGVETAHSIRISDARHGSITSSHTSAKSGTTVRLTLKPETDYIVESVEIRPATGSSIWRYPSGGECSFVMPDSAVTVYVEFSLRAEYNTFIPPQSQPQSQTQTNTHGSLPSSAFTSVTWRPATAMRDVPASSWAYPAAQWAYQNGYLDTAADGSFRLNDTVSHMQLWKIMANWMGEPALDDISVSQWARKSGAARIGASSGVMTRQNMVEYLYQCYFLMGGDVSVTGNLIQYRDGQQIMSGSAKNAWLWAVNKGIINGTGDGYLNPNKVLSRAEFASILMRLCQNG